MGSTFQECRGSVRANSPVGAACNRNRQWGLQTPLDRGIAIAAPSQGLQLCPVVEIGRRQRQFQWP